MRFRSTKRPWPTMSFSEAVMKAWADDGGMVMPTHLPRVSRDTLRAWAALSYPDLCVEVLALFVLDDVALPELRALVQDSFARFGVREVVRMRPIREGAVHVCELFHGPSLAFKDLGISVLVRFMQLFLQRSNNHLNLLVGTSGDTGPSAIEAVRDLPNISIVCLYPEGRVTEVQELQMTTAGEASANVHVIGVEGSSDDLDVPIEDVFRDVAFTSQFHVGSVNSVNICRVLVQAAHFFYAYLKVCPEANREVVFRIPTGAGGHVTGASIALLMGLPARVLGVCTNQNDVFHRIVSQSGEVRRGELLQTNSPAMDILVPYNLERLLHLVSGGDGAQVGAWMDEFKKNGRIRLPEWCRSALRSQLCIRSDSVSNQQAVATIARVWSSSRVIIDPHTAVGVAVALQRADEEQDELGVVPQICMGCAHPAKFLPTVQEALGSASESDALATLLEAEGGGTPSVRRTVGLLGKQARAEARFEKKRQGEWGGMLREVLVRVDARTSVAASAKL